VEDRAFLDIEIAGLGPIDLGADQIGGQQIRGELNALEIGPDRVGQSLHRAGLGQSGHAFDQDVALGEQADQQSFHQIPLADQHLPDLVFHGPDPGPLFFDLGRELLERHVVSPFGLASVGFNPRARMGHDESAKNLREPDRVVKARRFPEGLSA
jgi:hypothetical protein